MNKKHLQTKRDLMKDVIEKRTGLKLETLPDEAIHEAGKTYYCGYWQQAYKVLEYKVLADTETWWSWQVRCLWQDGRTTTHCTPLDPFRDYLVKN